MYEVCCLHAAQTIKSSNLIVFDLISICVAYFMKVIFIIYMIVVHEIYAS